MPRQSATVEPRRTTSRSLPALGLAAAAMLASTGCTHVCSVSRPQLAPAPVRASPVSLRVAVSIDRTSELTRDISWGSGHEWILPLGDAVTSAFEDAARGAFPEPPPGERASSAARPEPDAVLSVRVAGYRARPAGFPGRRAEIDVEAILASRAGRELLRATVTGQSPSDVPWELNTCAAMGEAATAAIGDAAVRIRDVLASAPGAAELRLRAAEAPPAAAGASGAAPASFHPAPDRPPDPPPDAAIATTRTGGISEEMSRHYWSVSFHLGLGWGHDAISSHFSPDPMSAGFALLVRRRSILAGAFVTATGGGNGDGNAATGAGGGYGSPGSAPASIYTYSGVHVGGAAGVAFEPAPWARTELLVEAGGHYVDVESGYAYQPDDTAWIPFLGLRTGAFVYTNSGALFLGVRRVGIGLEAGVRTDLGRRSVAVGSPPELSLPKDVFGVGGTSVSVQLVLPLEW